MYEKKHITIFNKNNISIIEYPNVANKVECWQFIKDNIINYSSCRHNYNRKCHYETIKIKKVSKLGFYYWSTEVKTVYDEPEIKDNPNKNNVGAPAYKTAYIYGKDFTYVIKYVYSHGDNTINVDLRPWEVMNKNGMPDHFVTDLYNSLQTVFEICKKINKEYKNVRTYEQYYSYTDEDKYYNNGIGNLRKDIYKDLFGDPRGPRYQTNDEKILAHGFDLKTSFRKDKEKK